MPPFVLTADSPLPPPSAWARVTDWPAHGRHIPLTSVRVTPSTPTGVGTVFVARTGLGRLGFDDPMEVVAWDPPRFCRIEKRGRVVLGWAELTVEPRDTGSRVTWREDAVPARLPAFTSGASAAVGRRVFGRVLRGLLAEPG